MNSPSLTPADHDVLRAVCGRGMAQSLLPEEVAEKANLDREVAQDILRRLRNEGLITSNADHGRRRYWSWRAYSEVIR